MKESKIKKEINVAIKSEEQYLAILNSLTDPMHIIDRDYNIQFLNSAMVLWLNKLNLNSDIVDKTIFEAFPFLEYDKIHIEYNSIFKTGELLITTEATQLATYTIFTETLKFPVKSNGKVEQVITIMRDITEQKEAEERLKASEEKYRNLFEKSPNAIVLLNFTGKIIDCNIATEKTFGYSTKDLIGRKYLELPFYSKNIKNKLKERFQAITKEFEIESQELEVKKQDGSILRIKTEISYFKIGEKKYFQAIIQDITEQKKAEQQLKESEKKYRALFDNSPIGIGLSTLEGEALDSNDAMEELTGYSIEDLNKIGMASIYVDQNARSEMLKLLQEVGKVRDYETKLKRKDNTEIFGSLSLDLNELDGKKIIQSSLRDITERKKAEEKLKDSEENFRTIAEDSHLAITILQDDLVVYTNQRMADMFGYEREEMLKWTPKEYAKTVAEDSLDFIMEQARKKQIGDPDVITQYPIHCVKSSGEKFWVDNISTTIIYNGRPADLVTIIDTTDKRKAQQKLKESEEKFRTIAEQSLIGISIIQDNIVKYVNNKMSDILGYSINEIMNWTPEEYINTIHPDYRGAFLEQAKVKQQGLDYEVRNYQFQIITKSGNIIWVENYIREIKFEGRSADLIIYIDITERKEVEQELLKLNNIKSELLRRTSHELKTPLVSIKGFSDLLLEVHRDKLDSLVISTLNEIKQGCLRLETLIADILKTAELESGTIQLHKSEEDLSFLVRVCVNEIKGFSKLRNHTINLELQERLITQFEKEQIHQVISNLLNNAVKYTPPSGLIEIKSDIRDAFIVLAIKDNGIGFTEEEKTRIFKQFGKIERYGQGMDIIAEGSGFGLFISKKIIELHGGEIWVESEGRNMGSTFYFSLPIY